jgi:hypothetical protein
MSPIRSAIESDQTKQSPNSYAIGNESLSAVFNKDLEKISVKDRLHLVIETPLPGITIYRQLIKFSQMQSIFNEWDSNIPPFAFHSFSGGKGSYYSPRRSLVLRYNGDMLYRDIS